MYLRSSVGKTAHQLNSRVRRVWARFSLSVDKCTSHFRISVIFGGRREWRQHNCITTLSSTQNAAQNQEQTPCSAKIKETNSRRSTPLFHAHTPLLATCSAGPVKSPTRCPPGDASHRKENPSSPNVRTHKNLPTRTLYNLEAIISSARRAENQKL